MAESVRIHLPQRDLLRVQMAATSALAGLADALQTGCAPIKPSDWAETWDRVGGVVEAHIASSAWPFQVSEPMRARWAAHRALIAALIQSRVCR